VHDPSRAFEVALAVLVVSCPCALSLAIPAALAVAQGALSRTGVLPLHGDAIDTLARADVVVFDKTGTLGDGRPAIDAVETFGDTTRERALQLAAALERHSLHPLARAFADVDTTLRADEVRETAGLGIEGSIDGRRFRLGRRDFVAPLAGDAGGHDAADGLWLADGTNVLARIALREGLREGAAAAVAALAEQGLHVQLCSGDGPAAVQGLADATGIADARSRQSPAQKLELARRLQANGHVVAMVGDGLNDAPVLAGADVSFAMSDGAALAQRAADFVVTSPSLLRIPQAVALARRARAVVRQNLAWALAYNIVALPLAASGHVPPWMAALGMAGSSLLVTLNALRLAHARATVAAA
jgi:Cu2+-exporting ATPase